MLGTVECIHFGQHGNGMLRTNLQIYISHLFKEFPFSFNSSRIYDLVFLGFLCNPRTYGTARFTVSYDTEELALGSTGLVELALKRIVRRMILCSQCSRLISDYRLGVIPKL